MTVTTHPGAADDLDAPRDRDFDPPTLRKRLTALWRNPPGFLGWMMSVDHKSIGRRYIVTGFIHLFLAGALAMVIRLQLVKPDSGWIGPDLYNQIFTMHGTVMMFLFAVPIMEGVGVYFVPLMVGTRAIAFPRLNAFSYWIYLAGGLMLWTAFALNIGPDAGWFSYPPLAGPAYGAGKRSDYYAQMITFTEVSGLAVAVELIVTILKLRAPGMRLDRMPIFVWAMLITSVMIVAAMPGVVLSSTFLLLDRLIGTHFYNYTEGGDVLLWQHLFWFFAHPEVYIIFLPALGMGAQIIETFTRRPVFGYTAIVLSLIATSVLAFGLWVHHMFATGLPRLGNSFYTAASMSIAIPTGVNLFCWIATIATGRVRFSVPFLWILSFFVLFIIGGLSGIFLASVPIDLQVTDTYVIVAHIHFVLLGGAVAPLLGAAFYWFPKLTGRTLNEALGRWQVTLYTIGVGVGFGAMFVLGLRGMTRRVYTYPAAMDWHVLNFIASVAGWLIGLSFLLFAISVFRALSRPQAAPDNPWDAASLEWAAASPPEPYNFDYIRQVGSRSPLWEEGGQMTVTGLRADRKEMLATTVVDAQPDMREPVPKPTLWPFAAAVVTSIIFVGSIYTPDAISYGAIPFAIVMTGWLLPRKSDYEPPSVEVGKS